MTTLPRICPYCSAVIEGDPEQCPACGRSSSGATAPRVIADSTVKIVDVDIPFSSMVGLIFKWALAAIPALILLALIGGVISVFLTVLLGIG